MSETLTAAIKLVAEDGLSGPLARIEAMFDRLDRTIAGIGRQSGLESLEAAVLRNVEAIDRLNGTLDRTLKAERQAGEAGATMGDGIAAGARTATAALDVVQARLNAIRLDSALPGSREYRPLGGAVPTPFALPAAELPPAAVLEPFPTIPPRPPTPAPVPRPSFWGSTDWRGLARQPVLLAAPLVHRTRELGEATEHGVGRAFGAAVTGFGLMEPIKKAAEFDNTMRHIAITLGLSGAAGDKFVAQFTRQMDALARATGQSGEKLAEAAGFFSREGYSLDKINAVMPTVAKIATAYNADPDAVAKTTFALQENLGIGDKDLPGALSALAIAGKKADLPLEKLAPLFPEVAASAGALGVKGRAGVDDLASMLAVVRKSVGTEGEATTYAKAFIQTLTSPHTAKHFAAEGVDIYGAIENARKTGGDPMMAVLDKVGQITDNGKKLKIIGELFHNQEDKGFAQAILQHLAEYQKIHDQVSSATPKVLDEDFAEGSKSLKIQVQAFDEALEQMERRLGRGFAPVLGVITPVLQTLNRWMDWMDQHAPGVTHVLFGTVGGMLALATVMGAIGAVAPPIVAGFRLVGTALRPLLLLARLLLPVFTGITAGGALLAGAIAVVAGIIIAAAVDIYRHWDRFRAGFAAIGAGVMQVLGGIGQFVAGVFTGNWSKAIAGIAKIFGGLGKIVSGEWIIVKQLFLDFLAWVDSWTGGLGSRMLAGLQSGWHAVIDGFKALFDKLIEPLHGFEREFADSWIGRHLGGGPAPATPALPAQGLPQAPPANSNGREPVHVIVSAEPGTRVQNPKGDKRLQVQPDRGQMTLRP